MYTYHYIRIEIISVLVSTIYLLYTLLPSMRAVGGRERKKGRNVSVYLEELGFLYSWSYLSILSLIPRSQSRDAVNDLVKGYPGSPRLA